MHVLVGGALRAAAADVVTQTTTVWFKVIGILYGDPCANGSNMHVMVAKGCGTGSHRHMALELSRRLGLCFSSGVNLIDGPTGGVVAHEEEQWTGGTGLSS